MIINQSARKGEEGLSRVSPGYLRVSRSSDIAEKELGNIQ
jgi:hypothetical protein